MLSKYHQVYKAKVPINTPTMRCPVDRDKASKRICMFRVGAVGDIVMTTPLLAALRKAYPDAWITWVVEKKHCGVISANPYVDEIFEWHGGHWKKCVRRNYPPWSWEAGWLKRLLESWKLDIFISFHGEELGWVTDHSGAAHKIGFFDRYLEQRDPEAARALYAKYDRCIFWADHAASHSASVPLIALEALGLPREGERVLSFGFTEADRSSAADHLKRRGLRKEGRYISLVPFTTWESRNWAPDRFIEVCNRLIDEYDVDVVLLGIPKQEQGLKSIAAALHGKPIVFAGDLTLAEVGALILDGWMLLTCDTGPMHIAAGVGAPYVAVFGSTPSATLAPKVANEIFLQKPVPCGPCHVPDCVNTGADFKKCLELVTAEEVYQACKQSIARFVPADRIAK